MARDNKSYKEDPIFKNCCLKIDTKNKLNPLLSDAISFYKKLDAIYEELLAPFKDYFDLGLVFLVLDAKTQGFGIGKKLYLYVQDYLKAQNCKHTYVYTDTWCNYKFYEALGFSLKAKSQIVGRDDVSDVFMYEKIIN